MIKINLVAEGRKPVVKRPSVSRGAGLPSLGGEQAALITLIAAVLLCGAVYGIWYFMINGTVKENQRQIREAQNRVAQLQEYIDQVERFERKQAELEQKIDVITELKNSQRGPVEIMDQISRAMPELLWIDRLDQKNNDVTVTGRAFNPSAIENFIKNLDESPVFEEPTLNGMSQRQDVYEFTLVLTKITTALEEEESA